MELDKRIRDITDIQSVTDGCHDWEYMNKKGYFSDSITNFKNLNKCVYGEYKGYFPEKDRCFSALPNGDRVRFVYHYFIPEDALKPIEKTYRPFTNEEFFDLFDAGKLFSIRKKNKQGRFIITEVYFNDNCEKDKVYVKLNHCGAGFGIEYLLRNDFEFYDCKEWKIFGVEVKE